MNFSKGFTLAEFIILVAIVVGLTMIAFPVYKRYAKNAYMSEGESLLMTIKNAQKKYIAQNGIYYDGKDAEVKENAILDIDASTNKNFKTFSIIADNVSKKKSYTATVYGKNSKTSIRLKVSEDGKASKNFKY